ncbi:hypothetical protein [Nitrosomonas oligotropha]|uniref:hypothetical protein n=1 Tax=Nitrosomonas oligotropha TaxID=42354 RepID=UPI001370EB85|nr:hypothetical protein [Nitrosomonas oligotropha]
MIKNLTETMVFMLTLGVFLLLSTIAIAQSHATPPETLAEGDRKDSGQHHSIKNKDGHSGQKIESSSDSKHLPSSSNKTHLPSSSPNPSNPAGASPGNPLGATQNPQPNLNTN